MLPQINDVVKKLAVETAIPKDVIEAIVSHQFQGIAASMKRNDIIELSGFGRFIFNKKKAVKKLASWEKEMEECLRVLSSEEITNALRKRTEGRASTLKENILILKQRLC
jgi:hypothetical protein